MKPSASDISIQRQAEEVECVVAERRQHIQNMRKSTKIKYPEEVITLSELRLVILQRAARTIRAVANNEHAVRDVLMKRVG